MIVWTGCRTDITDYAVSDCLPSNGAGFGNFVRKGVMDSEGVSLKAGVTACATKYSRKNTRIHKVVREESDYLNDTTEAG